MQVHFKLTKPLLLGYQQQVSSMPDSSFHQIPTNCIVIRLNLLHQNHPPAWNAERTTYLEPVNQLQWLAVILVCFKDYICQFMYDHIQRALIFNGFGEVKLKKPERNILLTYRGSKLLSLLPSEVLLPHKWHLLYTVPLFCMLSKSLRIYTSLNVRKLYSDTYFSAV